MKTFKQIFIIFIAAILFQNCSKGQNTKPDMNGWYKAGSKPESYEIGVETEKYNNGDVYFMNSIAVVTEGFGTIMKDIKPDSYKGKRVKLSSFIKTENIESYAGMWMRIDSYEAGKMLGFDNMNNRPIKGTTDWKKYEITLDVPDNSAGIFYGVLAAGSGHVWLTEPTLEIVGEDIPVTNLLSEEYLKGKDNYSELPQKLNNIPNGIEAGHNPQTVLAEFNKKESMYYWNYKTTVKPVNENLEIVEFGSYLWYNDHWEFATVTGKPFEKKDFAQWYNCKNGKMKKGKEYSDKSNWNNAPVLQKGRALWYYIGKNSKGELFKGTAIVDYLPELQK